MTRVTGQGGRVKAKASNLTWRLKRNLRKTEVSAINLFIKRLSNTIRPKEIYNPSENSKVPIWIVSHNLVISANAETLTVHSNLCQKEEIYTLALLIKAYLGDFMEIDTPDFDFPIPNSDWIAVSNKLEREGFVVSWNCVETNVARHLNPIVTPPFELLD